MRWRSGLRPCGKPVETAATGIPEPSERLDGGPDEGVVDADGAGRDGLVDAERGEDLGAHGVAGLLAEPPDRARRVVAAERRQVDRADGVEQPRGLVRLLDRPPRAERGGAALDGAAVDAHVLDR